MLLRGRALLQLNGALFPNEVVNREGPGHLADHPFFRLDELQQAHAR
jgi:hypothetical protein